MEKFPRKWGDGEIFEISDFHENCHVRSCLVGDRSAFVQIFLSTRSFWLILPVLMDE